MKNNIEHRLALSYYNEIASLNQAHKVSVVQHTETGKIYVKKVLNVYNSAIYRFLYENPIPGIPRIVELSETDDCLTVIEEYISGKSLLEMLSEGHAFTADECIYIALQLCDIITQLHSLNTPIIHRDIKPSNVLFTSDSKVYLIDLNAAKFLDESRSEDTVLLGTQGYAAPEQYGFGSSTKKTDIYSIGVLMNTLITHDPKIPVDRSCRLYTIITKCTQINPEQRYKNADALKQSLLSLPSEQKVTYPAYESWKIPGFRSGNPLNMCVAVVGYLAIAFLSFTLKSEQQTTLAITLYERGFIFLSLLATVFFACDYRGLNRHLPLCRSNKAILRLTGIALFSVVLWLAIFFIMIMIEAIIF